MSPRAVTRSWGGAVALHRLGKLQESLAALERVSQLGPSNPEALYVKGIVLQQLDQQQEAVAAYSKATAIAPPSGPARTSTGPPPTRALGRRSRA
jgi:Flp pilus assembly protein TadD